jgi:CPA2 family monovalent cation:H+ antiporter-2
MLINPALLKQYMWPVLLLIVMVVIGKTVFVSLGALLAGQPLKQSVQAGTSMSQIGEFSFIIATLGVSLKVTSDYLYPIAVGVSVITTFTTPFMMKLAEPLYKFIEKILPAKWVASLNRYSSNTQTLQSESDWQKVVRSYLQLMLSNAVIIIACILLASYYVEPFFEIRFGNILAAKISAVVLTLGVTSPFIWALTARKMRGLAYKELWLDSKYNHGALLLLELARNIVAIICWGFLLNRFFSFYISVIGTLVVMPVVLLLFRQKLEKFYGRIQTRFLDNLNKKEEQKQTTPTFWDAHLVEFEVSPYAAYAGRTLQELAWREKYAINIAYILRADKTIPTPSRFDKLFPYDKIGVVATDQQLQAIKPVVENDDHVSVGATDEEKENIGLMSIVIDEHTRLKGLSIRESAIREKTNGLIVGVERNNQRVLNPSSDTIFEWGDVVWLVGDKRKIRENYVR